MKISGNTVLITGGASGIGFHLAEEFVKAGNEVLICGRRDDKLVEAKSKLPGLHTRVCDVSQPRDREALYNWVVSNFKGVNVLVNNAGIQRMIDLKNGIQELLKGDNEVDINLTSAIHLSALFIPPFIDREEAAIINISSGLGFIPLAIMPVYCATKAALHSFTISLRHQLKNTPVKVFEVIPPTVDTELDKGARARRGQAYRGIPPSEVAISTMTALEKDEFEHAIGQAQNLVAASKANFEEVFNRMNH
jgi:uncharacterized oxidoreductase